MTIIAERYGDRVAIEDGATTLSFAQLPAQVERATQAMIAHGIAPGDRVAIWAPNMWEWIVATLGLHSAGAILVPINTRYKAAEAAYMLRKAHVKMLLTVTDFLNTDYVALLQAHGSPPEALETTVVMRGHAPEGTLSWDAFLEHGHTVSSAQARERAAQVSPEDLSDILFTSGTTGQPKGAMCTHAQSLRAYRDWSHVVGLTAGDRYLVVAPFFHCFGYKAGWLAALMMGATVLPQPIFDPVAVMKRIGQDRVSMLPGPPALYQTLLGRDDLGQHDLSSLRLAVTGAAVIPVELIQRMKDELGFETVITGYGLTEACGIATMCRTDDEPTTIAQTSGRAIPDVEVKVVDTAGNTVEPNTPGEVMVRGYNVMKGYLDEPQQTEATLDADGWLHTGDIGVMDAQGYIRITDRKKDMFIMGGFNCYPAEIESLMLRNEDLVQAAVIGVPDARMGEVGMAFVTAREGAKVDEASIVAWCRKAMANFKVPRYIEVVEALPMNATGKVQKFVLRERAPGLLAARTTAEPPS
ncbi:MAG: FadD3 family acyl-CoA ligase [Myxococcota bacterium]